MSRNKCAICGAKRKRWELQLVVTTKTREAESNAKMTSYAGRKGG